MDEKIYKRLKYYDDLFMSVFPTYSLTDNAEIHIYGTKLEPLIDVNDILDMVGKSYGKFARWLCKRKDGQHVLRIKLENGKYKQVFTLDGLRCYLRIFGNDYSDECIFLMNWDGKLYVYKHHYKIPDSGDNE